MNTPTHVVVSMLALGRREHNAELGVVVLGAVLPDLAMIAFYGWQKLVIGASESTIWNSLYFLPAWQHFFDTFNSLPIFLALSLVALALRSKLLLLLIASMTLHVLGDLPVHREDAHRHFFPLSEWTFMSPVSYWDPCFYGDWFTLFEGCVLTAGIIILWRRYNRFAFRAVVAALGTVTAAFVGFVFITWGALAEAHVCS